MDDPTNTARNQLNDATTDADIDSAQNTMETARIKAQGYQTQIVSLSIKTQAGDYMSDALPSARDFFSARGIVNASNTSDRDDLLLLNIQQKIDMASSTAQDQLLEAQTLSDIENVQRVFGTAKADALETLRKILSLSIRAQANDFIANAKPSAEDIEAARTRVSVVATSWLKKYKTWIIIIGAVVGVLFLGFLVNQARKSRSSTLRY
jgi:hypothetical protein